MNPLKCDDVKNSLVEYLEFELPMQRREQLYEHLLTCRACRNMHDNMQEVLIRIKHDEVADPGTDYWDSLADNVLQGVRQARREGSSASGVRQDNITAYPPGEKETHHFDASNVVVLNRSANGALERSVDHPDSGKFANADDTNISTHTKRIDTKHDNSTSRVTDKSSTRYRLRGFWPRVVLPVAAAVLVGVAVMFSLLEKPVPYEVPNAIGFQAQINSEQSLAQLAQKIAPLAQSANRFGFSSQPGVFNSFSIGSLFSEARALATGDRTAPLKTQLALLKTALLREKRPQSATIAALENIQKQLARQNNLSAIDNQLVALLNEYVNNLAASGRQEAQLAAAGAWLFDYALAAVAQDAGQLRRTGQLQNYKAALQQVNVPPGVTTSFDQLIAIAQKASITPQDFRRVVAEVENIRSLLG